MGMENKKEIEKDMTELTVLLSDHKTREELMR